MSAAQTHTTCGLRAAAAPPEARGLRRDQVRLLVSTPDRDVATEFSRFASFFGPRDLLVINTSGTRRSAVDIEGSRLTLHVSSPTAQGDWIVEFRSESGRKPHRGVVPVSGRVAGVRFDVVEPFNDDRPTRLWRARFDGDIEDALARHGRHIVYDYAGPAKPEWRQNVYATTPGSAELASAGRPLTWKILQSLEANGVRVAPLVLHCGVSSQESGESPHPEFYDVPADTMRAVFDTRARGGRVIAVGTTVVRALETVARTSRLSGFTSLILGDQTRPVVIDGVLSGFHPPEASHLNLLGSLVGDAIVRRAYDVACGGDFRSHEFGDSHLLFSR